MFRPCSKYQPDVVLGFHVWPCHRQLQMGWEDPSAASDDASFASPGVVFFLRDPEGKEGLGCKEVRRCCWTGSTNSSVFSSVFLSYFFVGWNQPTYPPCLPALLFRQWEENTSMTRNHHHPLLISVNSKTSTQPESNPTCVDPLQHVLPTRLKHPRTEVSVCHSVETDRRAAPTRAGDRHGADR